MKSRKKTQSVIEPLQDEQGYRMCRMCNVTVPIECMAWPTRVPVCITCSKVTLSVFEREMKVLHQLRRRRQEMHWTYSLVRGFCHMLDFDKIAEDMVKHNEHRLKFMRVMWIPKVTTWGMKGREWDDLDRRYASILHDYRQQKTLVRDHWLTIKRYLLGVA